ncbi:alanine/glycine:cation symporter family protein [Ancrocorticia populi]|uniref:alanine/glycine:cation symporter family protein n=1 Tax=Ancrocorticia populi TaxID=2175228 RepID=UPI003F8D9DE8
MDSFNSVLETISGWVWGPWCLIPLLFVTGVILTWRLRGIQITKLIPALRLALFVRQDKDAEGGDVSQFQALTTALAATVGTGNIVGVATAVLMGGPGAIFWMWVSGFFGMASKYSEAFLAVRYRTRDDKGEISGGPQYYLQRGIKGAGGKILALTFSVFAVLASFGIGNMTQANAISANMEGTFNIPTWVTGGVLAILALLVLVGGIKSIGRVTERFVPFMILVYVVATIVLLVLNAGDILPAFGLIFSDAFTGQAVAGGALGTVIRFGMARGIFSNESGMGSAAIAAAAAKTTHPVRQGLVSMTQTFIDTMIVVTCTGIAIVTSGVWNGADSDSAGTLTGTAFDTSLPGQWGSIIVTLCLAMFAFSTILGWCYYGERNVERLVGVKWVLPYRVLFSLIVFVGATTSLSVVWNVADILNGLMAIPNLIGLIVMSGLIARETKYYLDNDPHLRANKQEIDTFMDGHPGGIDTYETSGV